MATDKATSKMYKKNYSIKAVPTSTITICGTKYKVTSVLFHDGPVMHEGHYTSMLRYGRSSWIFASDTKTDKKSWPRNAKGSYIFFLEQIRK